MEDEDDDEQDDAADLDDDDLDEREDGVDDGGPDDTDADLMDERDDAADDRDATMLRCPTCHAQVYEDAEKCNYCGEWVVHKRRLDVWAVLIITLLMAAIAFVLTSLL